MVVTFVGVVQRRRHGSGRRSIGVEELFIGALAFIGVLAFVSVVLFVAVGSGWE